MIHLVDASVFVFRAWFSIPATMTDSAGRPVNAVYGFARFILEFLDRARPAVAAVAFDESLNTSFRNEIYPAYKANREPAPEELKRQFRWCREFCGLAGLAHFADPRYEADDIIGTLAARARTRGMPTVILTRDKDLAQVMRAGDEFWNYVDGRRIPYDEAAAHFGARPERMADYQALVGDAVDNIPGVPGIGPKTAAALLAEFESLEALLAAPEAIAALPLRGAKGLPAKLVTHREAAFLARRLTRIATDMPLAVAPDDLAVRPPDTEAIAAFCERLGLARGLARSAARLAAGAA